MRFTRQFPVYYCCVQVVPDKINQCLWIIAGEHSRRRSVAERVYPGLLTRAVQCPYVMSNTQKLPQTTDPGLLRWRYVSLLVLAEVFGLSTWVWWSLICGGGIAVPVEGGGGEGHTPAPNPISTERLRRLTCSGQGAELFLFLVLSFNRIRLLIISWTSLRPYFNLSWRAGEIRALWLLLWSPGSRRHAAILEEPFVLL